MTLASEFENWSHKSGYRVNADGKRISYEHDSKGILAFVEAEVDPEEGIQFRAWLQDENRENMEYPEKFNDKDDAFDQVRKWMAEHN